MVRELVIFLREFAIGTVVEKVEVCVFLFCLACWLGLFLCGDLVFFPFDFAALQLPFWEVLLLVLSDVVESGFIDV